jgi:hypothetical protein
MLKPGRNVLVIIFFQAFCHCAACATALERCCAFPRFRKARGQEPGYLPQDGPPDTGLTHWAGAPDVPLSSPHRVQS